MRHDTFKVVLAAVHLEAGPEAVPLGAACTAAALKAAFPGLAVCLAEACVEDGAEALAGKIKAGPLDGEAFLTAVGFSLYSWNRETMLGAAALLREEKPDWFLFCGGPEATALPGGLSQTEGGPFDEVISGEGESGAVRVLAACRTCEYLHQKGANIPDSGAPWRLKPHAWLDRNTADATGDRNAVTALTTESAAPFVPGDFAAYPSPWLDGTLDAAKREGVLWELARGCPYTCAYCYESSAGLIGSGGPVGSSGPGNKRVRYIGEERLLAELRLFLRVDAPYVFVLDPTFNADDKRAIRILDLIERETRNVLAASGRRARTKWHFEIRAELITGEQARRFARLGASLQIGLQTADPKIAALISRSFDRGRFMSGINRLNREGVIFGLDLIYGLPTDTLAGFKRSLDFALSLYPNNLDLFPLAVLPGTALWERATEWGLETAKPEASSSPQAATGYEVTATPNFPAADLAKAKKLCEAADVFYNQGRAVAWFNQVLYPLKIKPSAFLEGFASFANFAKYPDGPASNSIEEQQLNYLSAQYQKAKKTALLSAVRDVVRYHGAWGRALAENAVTVINFSYDPDEVLGEADLQSFAATASKHPVTVQVGPGKNGVEMRRLTRPGKDSQRNHKPR
jgi:radical SAM superfamily enzyme YgiQ (UPF0313 family)